MCTHVPPVIHRYRFGKGGFQMYRSSSNLESLHESVDNIHLLEVIKVKGKTYLAQTLSSVELII